MVSLLNFGGCGNAISGLLTLPSWSIWAIGQHDRGQLFNAQN